MGMLSKLVETGGNSRGSTPKWQERQALANQYVEQALGAYFSRLGVDPFQEG